MTRKDQIKSAYKLTGGHASFYDGMMTYSTLPGKAICRIVWNMDGEKNLFGKAAGGPGRDRRTYHACLPGIAGCGYHLSGLFREYDGIGTGKGQGCRDQEYQLPAGRRRSIAL